MKRLQREVLVTGLLADMDQLLRESAGIVELAGNICMKPKSPDGLEQRIVVVGGPAERLGTPVDVAKQGILPAPNHPNRRAKLQQEAKRLACVIRLLGEQVVLPQRFLIARDRFMKGASRRGAITGLLGIGTGLLRDARQAEMIGKKLRFTSRHVGEKFLQTAPAGLVSWWRWESSRLS